MRAIMVAIGALHDPLDFVAVEVPSRRALGHEIPEGLHAYHRIDHLLDGFRRMVQRHGGHLKQQSGLAGDTFEIRQEFVHAFFGLRAHLMHELEQQLDEPIRDGPHMAITEQRNQPIASGSGWRRSWGRDSAVTRMRRRWAESGAKSDSGSWRPEAAGGCPLQSRGLDMPRASVRFERGQRQAGGSVFSSTSSR